MCGPVDVDHVRRAQVEQDDARGERVKATSENQPSAGRVFVATQFEFPCPGHTSGFEFPCPGHRWL